MKTFSLLVLMAGRTAKVIEHEKRGQKKIPAQPHPNCLPYLRCCVLLCLCLCVCVYCQRSFVCSILTIHLSMRPTHSTYPTDRTSKHLNKTNKQSSTLVFNMD